MPLDPLMVPVSMATSPAIDLSTRMGRLPAHARVLYVKDLAITLVVLLALPYLVHRLLTRPGKVLDGGSNVSLP